MLQRAASNAYSWWWASHIRTKQSKWLEQSLQDMGEKAQYMLKLIEEDGDSFAKRAEMYYKKRPELINFVEESYRAFRALAERYDHLSTELQNANNTIATLFPDQIQLAMEEEEDFGNPPKLPKGMPPQMPNPNSKSVPKVPPKAPKKKDWKGIINASKIQAEKTKAEEASKSATKSGLTKPEALEEIDKLQKEILALQTVKEFVKSSYQSGLNKYWSIENQIVEMQQRVCSLQDEFSVNQVIEDDEARTLMAEAALKSCQETLARLQEKQELSNEEAKKEYKKIEEARKKLKSIRREFLNDKSVDEDEEHESHESDSSSKGAEKMKGKEETEMGSFTVSKLADKIDELVNKVISLETAVSSQTVLIERLRTEADDLHGQFRVLETDKAHLIDDTHNLKIKVQKMEEKLHGIQALNHNVKKQNKNLQSDFAEAQSSLDHLSEKLNSVKPDEEIDIDDDEVPTPEVKHEYKAPESTTFKQEEPKAIKVKESVETNKKQSEDSNKADKKTAKSLDEVQKEKVEQNATQKEKSEEKEKVEQNATQKEKSEEEKEKVEQNSTRKEKSGEEKEKVEQIATQKGKSGEEKEQNANQKEKSGEQNASQKEKSGEEKEKVEQNATQKGKSGEEKEQNATQKEKSGEQNAAQKEKSGEEKEQNATQKEKSGEQNAAQKEKSGEEKEKVEQNATQKEKSGEEKEAKDFNWQQMLLNGMEDKEKVLLTEYTTILRNYKDTKKKLGDMQKKDKDHHFELALQIRELRGTVMKKDEEIQNLRNRLNALQGNSGGGKIDMKEDDPSLKPGAQTEDSHSSSNKVDEEIKSILTESEAVSPIEEKFRMDIDGILEENLAFWIKFSTSYHQVQKFKTTVQDLQRETFRLKDKKKQEESTGGDLKSEVRATYKHMKEIRTELSVWMEQSVVLKDELVRRFTSLCNIQEKITVALNEGMEEEEIRFSSHQAAKFQGEILNMKQENNKVREELQAGVHNVTKLQGEIENTLRMLDDEFGLSGIQPQLRHSPSVARIPLRSFIFGTKLKKQKHSIFPFTRKYQALRAGLM